MVETVAAPPKSSPMVVLAKKLVDAENKVAEIEESLKQAKKVAAALEAKLCDIMVTEKVKSFKTEEYGGFRSTTQVYPNVVDREALNAFVSKDKKLKFLYTVSIHGTKLRAYVRELMENSKEIPPGIDPYLKQEIRRFK